tara:strand:+ start:998 stop:1207 length:210 start_codon:yes stop_codon:yes gene_type:complete
MEHLEPLALMDFVLSSQHTPEEQASGAKQPPALQTFEAPHGVPVLNFSFVHEPVEASQASLVQGLLSSH